MFDELLRFQLKNEALLKQNNIFDDIYKITNMAMNECGNKLEELKNEYK